MTAPHTSRTGSRAECLALLHGRRIGRVPVFSGLPSLTASGLRDAGVRYADAHADSERMARTAASTFERFGFESAVVPFDLCVEAEALGCQVDFQQDSEIFLAPVISKPLDDSAEPVIDRLATAVRAGRIPLVAEALRRLKNGVGRRVVVGAWVPGPFTLAWQLFGAESWLSAASSQESMPLLFALASFISQVASIYRNAGADFITVHEMGGSPQVIGPRLFRSRVQPALMSLFAHLPSPNVLSVCGDTAAITRDLAASGAGALSVDQCTDVSQSRQMLGADAIILGNIDPMAVLSRGSPDDVARAVRASVAAGVDAVWPGCDLYPDIPDENMRALITTANAITLLHEA